MYLVDQILDSLQLERLGHLGNHDLADRVDVLLAALGQRLEDRGDLHSVERGIRDPEPHTAMAEHRVHFRRLTYLLQHSLSFLDQLIDPAVAALARLGELADRRQRLP